MHLHGIQVGQCAEAELKSCQRGGGSQREICLCSQELNILCLLFVVVALVVTVVVFLLLLLLRSRTCIWEAANRRDRDGDRGSSSAAGLSWNWPRPEEFKLCALLVLVWPGLVCSAQLNGQVDALIEGAPLLTSLLPALLTLASVSASF